MGLFRCDKCGHTFLSRGEDSKPKRCNQCWTTRVVPIEEESDSLGDGIINLEIKYNDKIQEIFKRLINEENINDIILELKVPLTLALHTAKLFTDLSNKQNEIFQLSGRNRTEQKISQSDFQQEERPNENILEEPLEAVIK